MLDHVELQGFGLEVRPIAVDALVAALQRQTVDRHGRAFKHTDFGQIPPETNLVATVQLTAYNIKFISAN